MSFFKEAELVDQMNKAVKMRPLCAELTIELLDKYPIICFTGESKAYGKKLLGISKRNLQSEMLVKDDDSIFDLIDDCDDFWQDECVGAGTKKNSQESLITHKNDLKGSTSSSKQLDGGEELNLNRPEERSQKLRKDKHNKLLK